MKKNIFLLLIPALVFVLSSCEKEKENDPVTEVQLNMGANQASDVYYSFANGIVKTISRSDWDIAFSMPLQTATIRINEGANVKLWAYGDTTMWNSVDTSGLSTWEADYNSKSDWMVGAFNKYATGGFNFGWGTYDFMQTHSVWADSIYVIQLTDGSVKKLLIKSRLGTDIYNMHWADIDGSNPVDASFSPAEYGENINFIHYSLVNNQVVEAEPDADTWDLLFTKYVVKIPYGPMMVDYPVMGVLTKQGLEAVSVSGVDPSTSSYTDASVGFTAEADVIGWEWKQTDPTTYQTILVENQSYFVKLEDGSIYKLYFTDYDTQNDGLVSFKVESVE